MDRLAQIREVQRLDGYSTLVQEELIRWLQSNPRRKQVREWLADILLDPRFNDSILGILEEDRGGVRSALDACESYLEILAACWLYNEVHFFNTGIFGDAVLFEVFPQQKVMVGGQRFRIDFLVRVRSRLNYKFSAYIAVECDGHRFHDLSEDQASRDRQRDRWLQTGGIPVLRFTGSELISGRTSATAQALSMCYSIFARAQGLKPIHELEWGWDHD